MRAVYLDYNATTPLDGAVRAAMLEALDSCLGNPSSVHRLGRQARATLDLARERLAARWGCRPAELVFTSGGTESNNLALLGVARARRALGRHVVTSAVEHHAVLEPLRYLAEREGFEITRVPVDAWGRVRPDEVIRALRPETILVSIMLANNEIGTIQPVAEIGRHCRERGIPFHTDAAQGIGKIPVPAITDLNADLVSACAHKLHGPTGAGVLYIRSGTIPDRLMFGGGQELDRRPGTENLPAIVGLVEAIERFAEPPVFQEPHIQELVAVLRRGLAAVPGVEVRTPPSSALCNTLALTVDGCDSFSLLAGLDLEGICASSGSACSAGSLEPSHVLTAMGVPIPLANSLVRFSLGRQSSLEDVRAVLATFGSLVARVRSCAPAAG